MLVMVKKGHKMLAAAAVVTGGERRYPESAGT